MNIYLNEVWGRLTVETPEKDRQFQCGGVLYGEQNGIIKNSLPSLLTVRIPALFPPPGEIDVLIKRNHIGTLVMDGENLAVNE